MKQVMTGAACGALVATMLSSFMGANAQDADEPEPFRLPFEILDGGGNVVFKVEQGSNGPLMTLGTGNNTIRLGAIIPGMAMQLQSGTSMVSAVAGQNLALVNTKHGSGTTSLGYSLQDGHGVAIDIDEKSVAELGVRPGRNGALRVFAPDGTPVVQAGSNPAHGGAGSAYFNDTAGKAFAYIQYHQDAGLVAVAKADRPVVTLGGSADGSGGKLAVLNNGGEQVFAAASSGSNGAACAYGSQHNECMSPK